MAPGDRVSGPELFGTLPTGAPVFAYTLRNASGIELRAMTYGGIILGIRVPDRDGRIEDVTLGFDDLGSYVRENPYFGAIIGRVANRIAQGQFTLDGRQYSLARNDGDNASHGGREGFDRRSWAAEAAETETGARLVLTRTSPDGEEGYPGNLAVKVTYTLTDQNELIVDYEAKTDKPTPVNLTQHTYFNLAGPGSRDILDHVLQLNADAFTPVSQKRVPTGELRPVEGTVFDFRRPTRVGARINAADEQLRIAGGYDQNFVLNRRGVAANALVEAARVLDPATGRVLTVSTTEPGVQFYSGNLLDGRLVGKGGINYARRSGLCLETQHFPDAPNQPKFPSVIVRAGEVYRSRTVFRFSTDAEHPA